MKIAFPKEPVRQPTRKEMRLFNRWVQYLSHSKLSQSSIYERAADLAAQGKVPN